MKFFHFSHNHPTKPQLHHLTSIACIYMYCIHYLMSANPVLKSVKFASVTEMALNLKPCLVFLFVFLVSFEVLVRDVDAAGECGKTPIRSAAANLSPCLGAAGNAKAKVPPTCCSKVGALLKTSPRCLCAILLSPLAKQAGIKPGIAIGIPKRCNISNRQAGKKCGKYTVP